MRRTLLSLATLLLSGAPAVAAPMAPPQQHQLLSLFNRYNLAIQAGNLDQALALRTTDARTALEHGFKAPNDRAEFLNASRAMVPEHVEVMHASINDPGDKALLVVLASKTVSGHQEQEEFDLAFVKQAGEWKLGPLAEAPGPGDIKRCQDQRYQPADAYQGGNPVTFAGRIEHADFAADHTLVLLVTGDTEVCAFLPDRAALQQHGLDPAIIQPWRIAEISGFAEKNAPQRVMVNSITVHAEE